MVSLEMNKHPLIKRMLWSCWILLIYILDFTNLHFWSGNTVTIGKIPITYSFSY